MATKKIGVLFGMEDTFPWALIQEINERARASGEVIEASPVKIGALRQDAPAGYAVILDRISHEVPFYRTFLKWAIAGGTQVVNNPMWWAADDKFFENVVALSVNVAVPKTVLLPHKEHPPNTTAARPAAPPSVTVIAAARSEAPRLSRPPKASRAHRSRPRASAPSQRPGFGEASVGAAGWKGP